MLRRGGNTQIYATKTNYNKLNELEFRVNRKDKARRKMIEKQQIIQSNEEGQEGNQKITDNYANKQSINKSMTKILLKTLQFRRILKKLQKRKVSRKRGNFKAKIMKPELFSLF